MPVRINIEGVGLVDFPDEMSEEQIAQAIETEIVPAERRGIRREGLQAEQISVAAEPLPATSDLFGGELAARAKSAAGSFARGAVEAIAGPLEAVGIGAEALERRFPGVFDTPPRDQLATTRTAQALREATRKRFPTDPEIEQEFVAGTVAQAAGSMAGMVGGGLAGRAAKAPALLVGAGIGAGQTGAEGYTRAKAAGADEEMAFTSFLMNLGVGTTEALPMGALLGKLNRTSKGQVLTTLIEAGQEGFQTFSSNVIADQLTPEDVDFLEKVTESVAAGGIVGALASAILHGKAARIIEHPEELPSVAQEPVLVPRSHWLPAPRTRMPEFSETTIDEALGTRPPAGYLPAPGETGGTILLPESPLGPRTEGYRIQVPPFVERVDPVPTTAEQKAQIKELFQIAKAIDPEAVQGEPFKAPTVKVDLRQLQKVMRKNTVSTLEGWADEVIKEKLGGTSANPFVDPEFMSAAIAKGAVVLTRGIRDFSQWSTEMSGQLGILLDASNREDMEKLYTESIRTAGGIEQAVTSAATSRKQVPALFTDPNFVAQGKNLDIGAGKFDLGKAYLEVERGVTESVPFDPFNRPAETNQEVINRIASGGVFGTVTAANVLNVIAEPEARANVINQAARALKPDGAAYFSVYEGNKSGAGGHTRDGFQNHRKAETYVEEVKQYFEDVTRKGSVIIARKPKSDMPAAWRASAEGDIQLHFGFPPQIMEWLRGLIPKARPSLVPVALDTSSPVPDFQPYDTNNRIANRHLTWAAEIPGFAWLFDPRSRADGPVGDSLRTRAYEVQVGKAIASALGASINGTIDPAFQVEPGTSRITNIQTTSPDVSTYISDVLEAIESGSKDYVLTPIQREAVGRALSLKREIQDLAEENDVLPTVDEDSLDDRRAYFPRISISRDNRGKSRGTGGAGIGARQFYEKLRQFKSEEEGASQEDAVRYEPSIERRLTTLAERVYRKIADKRLAEALRPMGETIPERRKKFEEAFPEKTQEQIIALATGPNYGEGKVNQPAFRDIVFPKELADTINQMYGIEASRFLEGVADTNKFLKGIGFTFDVAAPFLQGQTLMFSNPDTWGKGFVKTGQAFFEPQTLHRYVSNPDNQRAMRELSQMGVQFGDLQDMLAGLEHGQPITKLPWGIGKAAERFGRAFSTFSDVAIIEMWKGWRNVAPRDQWPVVAETLQTMLFHGRMEEIGVSPSQSLMERILLLAPLYLRGTVNYVAGATQGGITGRILGRGLASWALGGAFAYMSLMMLKAWINDEDDLSEMWDRMKDPNRGDWMMIPVKFPDGRVRNFGLGGSLRSIVRLMASLTDAVVNKPEKLEPGVSDNPILKFLRGKLAPVPGSLTDIALGRDFLGEDVTWKGVLIGRISLPLQRFFTRPGEPAATPGDIIPGILGLNVWSESLRNQFQRDREEMSQRIYDKSYEKLGIREMYEVNQRTKAAPEFAVKQPSSERLRELAYRADLDRQKRILKAMPESLSDKATELGLTIPGYDASITVGGDRIPLTKKQTETYEALVIEEYKPMIEKLFSTDRFVNLEPSRRQEIFNQYLGKAKEKARGRLIKSFGKE